MIDTSNFKSRIVQPSVDTTFLKATFYGEAGSGKTTLGASKKRGGKTLIADVEHGTLSIVGSGVDVVYLQPDYEGDNPKGIFDQLRELHAWLKKGGHPYDTLVIDSLTQAHKFVVTDTIREKVRMRESKSLWKASLEDYGIMTEKMRYLLWDLRALPMHIIYNCLSENVVSADGIVLRATLALTAKFAATVLAYSDVVGYLTTVKAKTADDKEVIARKLWLQSDGTFVAKARTPKGVRMPDFILQPTLDKLIGLYHGDKEEQK